MKIFIYKCMIVFFLFFILFQITIGATIREIKKQVYFLSSEENVIAIKKKIREEISSANKRDRYLDVQDAELIKEFFNKIKSELK